MKTLELTTMETIQAWSGLRVLIRDQEASIRQRIFCEDFPVTKETIYQYRAAKSAFQKLDDAL